jgi:hypothetical protein
MRRITEEALDKFNNCRAAATVGLGILIVDTCFHNAAASSAGADLGHRAAHMIPSAFIAPEVTDDVGIKSHEADLAFAIGTGVAATVLAKQTTENSWELVGVAAGAQTLATVADGLLANNHLLSSDELKHPDVGFSAVETAFVSKFLIDKIIETDNEKYRRALISSAVILGTLATFGASYIDSKNAGTDFASHASGIVVGAGASGVKHARAISLPWRRRQNLDYDAATETLAA